jgi:hypothetical protein
MNTNKPIKDTTCYYCGEPCSSYNTVPSPVGDVAVCDRCE